MLTDGNAQVVKPACKKHADAKRTALSLDGAARIFFYLFLLIKPLYLLSSGSLQLGDICLLLASACCLTSRRANFKIERIDLLMIGFVSSVIVIDGWYFCMYGDTSFLVYAMYYVFNLFAILLFRYLYEDRDFLRACCRCLRIALIIQFLIYVFGFGRWYDAARYMGTFNDPNQMGFFVLSSFAFILIANEKCGFKNRLGGCGRFSGRPRRPAPAASCGRLSYRTPCALPRRTPSASPPGTSGSTRRARRRTARRRPRASPSRGRTRP